MLSAEQVSRLRKISQDASWSLAKIGAETQGQRNALQGQVIRSRGADIGKEKVANLLRQLDQGNVDATKLGNLEVIADRLAAGLTSKNPHEAKTHYKQVLAYEILTRLAANVKRILSQSSFGPNPVTTVKDLVTSLTRKSTGVESSNLQSIWYDAKSKILAVRFTSGTRYQYTDVPSNVYDELLKAESHGKYFHRNIRMVYPYRKLAFSEFAFNPITKVRQLLSKHGRLLHRHRTYRGELVMHKHQRHDRPHAHSSLPVYDGVGGYKAGDVAVIAAPLLATAIAGSAPFVLEGLSARKQQRKQKAYERSEKIRKVQEGIQQHVMRQRAEGRVPFQTALPSGRYSQKVLAFITANKLEQ